MYLRMHHEFIQYLNIRFYDYIYFYYGKKHKYVFEKGNQILYGNFLFQKENIIL